MSHVCDTKIKFFRIVNKRPTGFNGNLSTIAHLHRPVRGISGELKRWTTLIRVTKTDLSEESQICSYITKFHSEKKIKYCKNDYLPA